MLFVPALFAPFPTAADFLMKYVTKDRLTEMLAEKLCARLTATDGERQRRAVSYCIGQLKVRENAEYLGHRGYFV